MFPGCISHWMITVRSRFSSHYYLCRGRPFFHSLWPGHLWLWTCKSTSSCSLLIWPLLLTLVYVLNIPSLNLFLIFLLFFYTSCSLEQESSTFLTPGTSIMEDNFHRPGGVGMVSLSCIGEGNGNPLQCSCLENPRDGGAWWAAIYGVAQSRTWLKRLSSSSSSSSLYCALYF